MTTFTSIPVQIAGTGSYLPDRILTNADLERMVETTDEWITTRTGIKERRIAEDDQATSHLAAAAARRAMADAGVGPEEIDLIIVGTVTPDMAFPATACYVQHQLGARNSVAYDIGAACSGFLYGLDIAANQISTGRVKCALVIGADKLSSIVNWKDRNTCVLFGDGAGAAILKPATETSGRLLSLVKGTDGAQTGILKVPGSGTSCDPAEMEPVEGSVNGTIFMAGREVFKHAVTAMKDAAIQVIREAGLEPWQIDMLIPHQANLRIIEAIRERLDMPTEKCFVNLHKYGNTSAAAVAIALDEANHTGAIKRGDHVVLVVFGAGLTWASACLRW